MFYLLHGQDTYRSKEKLNELVSHFKTKVSGLGFFRIEGENFSEAEFKELLRGKTLFEKKYVVVCEKVLENKYLQNAEEALNGFYTEETAAMQLLRGKIALHQAKYHQAKEFLENAYKLSPSEKEIYGTLQLVHEKLGNIQAAVDAHETYSLLKQEETQQRKRKKFSFLRVKAKPQE